MLSVISGDEQVQGSMAHMTVTREMLLDHGIPRVRRDLVLLRIRYEDAEDPDVREILAKAAAQGFSLELDELPGPHLDLSLLDLFTAVEFDIADWDPEALATTLAPIFARDAIALAVNVHDHVQREHARALGFEWFSGRFFQTPNLVVGKSVPIGNLETLVELSRLQGRDAQLDQLGARDRARPRTRGAPPALHQLGLLRPCRPCAVDQPCRGDARCPRAVALGAGRRDARRSRRDPPRAAAAGADASTNARARRPGAGDRIASDELFTIGLLSTVDAMFRIPIERVLSELPLTAEVCNALAHYTGEPGELLSSLISYERGDFRDPALYDNLILYASTYRVGLEWAREALGGFE